MRMSDAKRKRIRNIYDSMKTRCYKTYSTSYKNYGARGIKVCSEWLNSFESFYLWAINNGYDDDLSIDRINNSLGYSPENCQWATRTQQNRNTRVNNMITMNGKTQCLQAWLDELGIKRVTYKARIKRGCTKEEALRTGDLRHMLKGKHRDGLRGRFV